MSYEFKSCFELVLARDQVKRVREAIAAASGCRIVRESETEVEIVLGLRCTKGDGSEEITIHLNQREIYVAFHAATGPQREASLSLLQHVLETLNLASDFENQCSIFKSCVHLPILADDSKIVHPF